MRCPNCNEPTRDVTKYPEDAMTQFTFMCGSYYQKQIYTQNNFVKQCSTPIPCPHCNYVLREDFNYCPDCGEKTST